MDIPEEQYEAICAFEDELNNLVHSALEKVESTYVRKYFGPSGEIIARILEE